jgi:hypothetical protein
VNNKILFHLRIDRDLAQMLPFDDFPIASKHPSFDDGKARSRALLSAFSAACIGGCPGAACHSARLTPAVTPNGGMYIQDRAGMLLHGIVMDKWRSVSSAPLSSGLSFGNHLATGPWRHGLTALAWRSLRRG